MCEVHEVNMKQVWQGCEVSKYQGYSQHKIKSGVRDGKKGGALSKTWNKCDKGCEVSNYGGVWSENKGVEIKTKRCAEIKDGCVEIKKWGCMS